MKISGEDKFLVICKITLEWGTGKVGVRACSNTFQNLFLLFEHTRAGCASSKPT